MHTKIIDAITVVAAMLLLSIQSRWSGCHRGILRFPNRQLAGNRPEFRWCHHPSCSTHKRQRRGHVGNHRWR